MKWESWCWNPLTGFLSLKTHFGAQKPFCRWKTSLWNGAQGNFGQGLTVTISESNNQLELSEYVLLLHGSYSSPYETLYSIHYEDIYEKSVNLSKRQSLLKKVNSAYMSIYWNGRNNLELEKIWLPWCKKTKGNKEDLYKPLTFVKYLTNANSTLADLNKVLIWDYILDNDKLCHTEHRLVNLLCYGTVLISDCFIYNA